MKKARAQSDKFYERFLDLNKPMLDGSEGKPLFTEKDIATLRAEKVKRHTVVTVWDGKFKGKGRCTNSPKNYQGQWRVVNGKTVEDGLGVSLLEDGSRYEG